jgi:hypothetical protein
VGFVVGKVALGQIISKYFSFRITGFLDFVHHPVFLKLENTTFQKLDLFLSSGEGEKTPTQIGPLERANLNQWTTRQIHYSYLN